MTKENMIQKIEDIKNIYIFGAHARAEALQGYFASLYPDIQIEAFLVDDLSDNRVVVKDIPVLEINSAQDLNSQFPVFIATKGIFRSEITERLQKKGFQNIIPVTPEVDNFFRNAYVEKSFKQQGRDFVKLEELRVKNSDGVSENSVLGTCISDNRIYVAHSAFDKALETPYELPFYETPIYVGAALTDRWDKEEESVLTDNTGDNISAKNRQYCELTALYWMWKNAKEDILGLAHYRRHFILPENWQEIMCSNQVDVILPVPGIASPSITESYRERHDFSDWEYMLEYMKTNCPEDYKVAKEVFDGDLYSPCNMFITKKDILDELCGWLFPILDAVTEHGGTKEDSYANRYPGFISERLMTVFFYKNRERFRIVYADKTFLK